MSRSTISDAARADDNLLRIADWCDRHSASFLVQRNAGSGVRPERRVVVVVEPGWGASAFPWPVGDVAVGVHVDSERRLQAAGRTAPEALGRAVDALESLPSVDAEAGPAVSSNGGTNA